MRCPVCQVLLSRVQYRGVAYWRCRQCGGALLPHPFLGQFSQAKPALSLLRAPNTTATLAPQRKCPVCLAQMTRVLSGGGSVELENCQRCKVAWFDQNEFNLKNNQEPRFAPVGAAPAVSEHADGNVRRKSARWAEPESAFKLDVDIGVGLGLRSYADDEEQKAKAAERRTEALGDFLTQGLGQFEIPSASTSPITTYYLLFACLIATGVYLHHPPLRPYLHFHLKHPLAFIPWSWIGSAFAHVGFWHLVADSYFLLLFGTALEQILGARRLLTLFFIAHVAGILLDSLDTTRAHLLYELGASAGVGGLSAYFALAFPYAQTTTVISNYYPSNLGYLSVRVPAWAYMLGYFAFQAGQQWYGPTGNTGHLAHIGGGLAGLACWLWWRNPSAASDSKEHRR